MYYKIIGQNQITKNLISSLSSPSTGSGLKNANGSYVSEELKQAVESGYIVVADKRPKKVKLYIQDKVGLRRFCIMGDCNTRALMENLREGDLREEDLETILFCALGKTVELEKIAMEVSVSV